MEGTSSGKIITFYSYKGGTGRSMALANVAWILASNGKRVLVLDWDLEAPGLHTYFHPFLVEELTDSEGVIDFVIDFQNEAMTPSDAEVPKDWYKPHANILRYAAELKNYDFDNGGILDFVPAGRQGSSYSTRVNSFDWQNFYDRLGGWVFLEAAREKMKEMYDYILIDSRTGVSDTSGICTVQMPDILVVCFTLNNQSIEGAAAVANSVYEQRRKSGEPVQVFPVPMRTDDAEKEKLELRLGYVKRKFDSFLAHMPPEEREQYWEEVKVPYVPYYAYEEILAAFKDEHSRDILEPAEKLTGYLIPESVERVHIEESRRKRIAAQYEGEADEPEKRHHYLSYPPVEKDFVLRLHDELLAGSPSIPVWIDTYELEAGQGWDEQIVDAIRTCESLIFVMTRESAEDRSHCKQEWMYALKYKKPIIPILLDPELDPATDMPFLLGNRQYIDFTGSFDVGMSLLRSHLHWLASPEGKLAALKDLLADSRRDVRRANNPEQRARIQDDIDQLQKQIAHQQYVIDNPYEAERRIEESIERGLAREREPEEPANATMRAKFINPPPTVVPHYFQDRHVETKLIGDFLNDDALRLITVVGRGGIGKTTMVCRLLKSLESGRLPDDGPPLNVDGIVYLSEVGSHRITVDNLYADLCRLLPENVAERLERIYKDPRTSTEAKIYALLEAFPSGRYVLLLDNLENVIDPETRKISDAELNEALRALLNLPQHAVKVIVTTRFAPHDLALVRPERQVRLDLDEGLTSPYAENILREMDVDGKVGLRTAPEESLDEARRRTGGNPRALEALFAILSADRDISLREILDDTKMLLPEEVVEILVGEAFGRLNLAAQMVMQALAVYAPYPVTSAAVDYLLQPHLSGVDSAPVLKRLVNMQLARREARRYYLHQVDQAYALSRVPKGEIADREELEAPLFTQFALLHRAANYFEQARTPQETWRTIADLAPQLAEFELRYTGEDYDAAVGVLLEIDFDYLLLWGHSRLVAELHERLQGRLSDPQLEQRSVGNLGSAYYSIGRVQKAKTCYEQALEIAREIGDRRGEGRCLGDLGECYATLGQTERAMDHYQQALEIAREISDRGSEGFRVGNLGNSYSDLGQTERAIDHYQQALEIAREIGDRGSEGVWLGNLGNSYSNLGQNERAIEHHEQALEIAREVGDRRGDGNLLGNLGNSYSALGQTERAIEHHEQALVISREIGDRRGEGSNLGSLGSCYSSLGQTERAIEHHEQALEIAREIGDRRGEGNQLGNLGLCYSDLGQTERAIEHHEQALVISREIGDRRGEGNRLGNLGICYFNLGQIGRAIDYYEQTLGIAREIGDRRGEGNRLGNLGDCYSVLGQTERAIEHHEQALVISHEVGDRRSEGMWLGSLGNCYSDLGQTERAIEHYERALGIAREIGDRGGEGFRLGNMGQLLIREGEPGKAAKQYEGAIKI